MRARVLALRDIDKNSLVNSASGGAFAVFARAFLDSGGVVIGARMDSGGKVKHSLVRHIRQLPQLQGSIYVQSDMSSVYTMVEEELHSHNSVLFVGTPCQCFAVSRYAKEKRLTSETDAPVLLTCELICHGVPSDELFQAYLAWLSKKKKADKKIESFVFRTKKFGWGLYYYYYYYYRNGKIRNAYGLGSYDPYYRAFLEGSTYRSSCYHCRFAQERRYADITIGDYWGIEVEHPNFYSSSGTSLVILNSVHGWNFFEESCKEKCVWIESTWKKAASHNLNLTRTTPLPDNRMKIMSSIAEKRKAGQLARIFDEELRLKLSPKQRMLAMMPTKIYCRLSRTREFISKLRRGNV